MIQALFLQISQPLHFMGTIFRELDESQINVEDLFNILKMDPRVVEKPDAKQYLYQGGDITLDKVNYAYKTEDIAMKEG